jgi:hypothetical protein
MTTWIRPAIAIGFTLWVINGTEPPFKRATFPTFAACVVAGKPEIDSLREVSPDITWECLPDDF